MCRLYGARLVGHSIFVPDGWDADDAVFRNGEGMHKIGRDGRIGLGTRGRTASALCKSMKTVDVYFAKPGETFDELARRWSMSPAVLVNMNRVDSVINFRHLDCPAGKFPKLPTRHPVIKKLCDPILAVSDAIVKEVMHYLDEAKETVIEEYLDLFAVVQGNIPKVSDWVTARWGGKKKFSIGAIREVHTNASGIPVSFDIIYDKEDAELAPDPHGEPGTMIQNRDYETNVPLDRVVFIQPLAKSSGKHSPKKRKREDEA